MRRPVEISVQDCVLHTVMHKQLMISAANLSDDALLARVKTLADGERRGTVELVAHLAELDSRGLCLARGRSLFLYCTDVLHLSEHAAYNRIGAARAARRFPVILDRLADGSVNVTTVTLLAPHLTELNHRTVLDEAIHKTKDQVKEIVRRLDPLPPAPVVIRKIVAVQRPVSPATALPGDAKTLLASTASTPGVPAPARAPAPAVEPRAPGLFRIHVDVDGETREAVRRLQDLLARETGGNVSAIVGRAVRLLLKEVEREKLAATNRPHTARPPKEGSRHIPAAVRRAVWRRDRGRCAFSGDDGRCSETRFLEWHHVMPHGHQGPATVDNISLRCRAHNVYESEQVFGRFVPKTVREATAMYGVTTNSVQTEYER